MTGIREYKAGARFVEDLRSPTVMPQQILSGLRTWREITVDPVNGDDSPENDGYDRPLKTIFALCQRLSARTQSQGDVYFDEPYVRLKAGLHSIEGLPAEERNYYTSLSTGNAYIYGEWSVPLSTFQLDSIAGDTTRWSKPAGDPDWIVDAYAGKWIRYPNTGGWLPPGMPSEFYYFYYPILGNTTHELTLGGAWAPVHRYLSDPPPLGTTVDIVEMTSIVEATELNGAYFTGRGAVGWGMYWQWVQFRANPASYWLMYGIDVNMAFMSCHFLGIGGGLMGFVDSVIGMYSCLWENCFGGLGVGNSVAHLSGGSCINCTQHISGDAFSTLDISMDWHLRNCGTLFFPVGALIYDNMIALACRDVTILHDASNGARIWLGAPVILDNALAQCWVYTYGSGFVHVNGNRADTVIRGSLVHGIDMGWGGLSIADLKNVHGGAWFGSIDIEFSLTTPWT